LANDPTMRRRALLPIDQYTQLRPGFEAALVTKAVVGNAPKPNQPYAKVESTQSNLLLTKVFDFAGDAKDKQAQLKAAHDPAARAALQAQIDADRAAAKNPLTRQLRSYQFGGGPKLLFWHHPF